MGNIGALILIQNNALISIHNFRSPTYDDPVLGTLFAASRISATKKRWSSDATQITLLLSSESCIAFAVGRETWPSSLDVCELGFKLRRLEKFANFQFRTANLQSHFLMPRTRLTCA